MGNLSDFQRLLNKHIEETSSSDTEYKLTENDKKTLLAIVRNTLKIFLEKREIPEVISDVPAL